MQQTDPCECGHNSFESEGFGIDFCLACGLGRVSQMEKIASAFNPQTPLAGHQSYTRVKRFKKYLCRAMRQQSSCTVPRETWDYLLTKRPFRDAKHIHMVLKKARHLKRKCYDSLPFLTSMLCPHVDVPTISEGEKTRALWLFRKVDNAIKDGPFISYLFCLEYILEMMGRHDVCEHINKIQCPKRRVAYAKRLDTILKSPNPIMNLLRTPA